VIKPVIQLSTNASYVDIGVFAKEWQKIDDASRHHPPLYDHFYRKVFFSERAGLLIIPMPRIIYPYFTVKLLSDGPNYTHFKMNSIGYTTKLLRN
jgi:hypothetical protein